MFQFVGLYDLLQPGPKTGFEFGRRYEYIKSLEHHKFQKILKTNWSFESCFVSSLNKSALL